MQLAWQTDNESKQDIKAAMMGLREVQCSSNWLCLSSYHVFQIMLGCMPCKFAVLASLCSAALGAYDLTVLLAFKAVTNIELKVARDFVGAGLGRHVSGA